MKNEVAGNATSERFAKSLKTVLLSPNKAGRITFVQSHLPDYEPHFLVFTRYAFQEAVAQITAEVITKHADEFNTTYTTSDAGVEVTNKSKFEEIVKEVRGMAEEGLKKFNLPANPFLIKVVLFNIFDREVLEKVLPLVK